eukprot:223074-Pleurochrysis_carterae.AAC.1
MAPRHCWRAKQGVLCAHSGNKAMPTSQVDCASHTAANMSRFLWEMEEQADHVPNGMLLRSEAGGLQTAEGR